MPAMLLIHCLVMEHFEKGVVIVNKFYYEKNASVTPEFLLLATPFTKETRLNFGKQLSEKQFFDGLYADSVRTNDSSINGFDNQVNEALEATDNKFAKVNLIHIAGYAGCGKTTFVRHLLWQKYGEISMQANIVDFEGEKEVLNPLCDAIVKKIIKYFEIDKNNTVKLQNINQFEARRFGTHVVELCSVFINEVSSVQQQLAFNEIKKLLINKRYDFESVDQYLYYLLVLDFLWNLTFYQENQKEPFILLFDNLDSVDDTEQEKMFVSVLKNFIIDCNYFYGMNLDNENFYNGRKIAEILQQTKYVCFLTTRLVTIKRLLSLAPDFESVYGWTSIEMPLNYYNHLAIINKRMEYYKQFDEQNKSDVLMSLQQVVEFANNVYKSNNFMKLFNGSFRFSVRSLCNLVKGYSNTNLIEESNRLFNYRYLSQEAIDGSSGMILGILCHYLKRNGVYSEKLLLSECKPDGHISLSRIILTILHEKNGSCNMLDLLNLLSPFFNVDEICKTVYALNEAKRDIMRRMVTFDLVFPKSENDFLEQGRKYENRNYNDSFYSDVILCLSGKIYLDYVVPHFEFMLSRYRYCKDIMSNNKYRPLFSECSEQIISDSQNGYLYGFERKIDWVYKDILDSCTHSVQFAKKVMDYFNINRRVYINNSYFNYHSTNRDGSPGDRQSYESRLIFSQIGYIERYRRYLFIKRQQDSIEIRIDINRRLVEKIKRYVTLYQNSALCFQTEQQDKAANFLLDQINIIEGKKYNDFETKIEFI